MFEPKDFKKYIVASEATIQAGLDQVDVDTIVVEEGEKVQLGIIDPPVINGIDVREHPNPTLKAMYQRRLAGNNKLCGIWVNGKLSETLVSGNPSKDYQNAEAYEPARQERIRGYAYGRVAEEVGKKIGVENKKGNKKRPKNLTPDDFWAQFPHEKILNDINASEDIEVVAFVELINSKQKVNIKANYTTQGLQMLLDKGLITETVKAEVEG